ncbi:hypothetical protein ACFQL4_28970 [Halosimplex aquaticum]
MLHLLLLGDLSAGGRRGARRRPPSALCRARPLAGPADELVRQDELQFGDRDEPGRPALLLFLLFLVLFGAHLAPTLPLKEEHAGVDRFEVVALDRGTVFTDHLHRETPPAVRRVLQ